MPAQQLSPKKWGRPEYEKESTLAWHFSSCKNGKTLCSGRAGPAWWVNRILSLSKTWLPDSSVQPADVSLSKILNPQQLQGCLECFRFFCPGCLQESLIKIIIKPIICLKLSITAAPLLILCRNVSVSLSNPLPKSPFCCDCSPSCPPPPCFHFSSASVLWHHNVTEEVTAHWKVQFLKIYICL